MQAQPHLVYGVRSAHPLADLKGCHDGEQARERLGLPGEIGVQDLEEDWDYADGKVILYVKASAAPGIFSRENDGTLKSIAAPETDRAWKAKILDAVESRGIEIEGPPTWYAFTTNC